MERNGCPAFYTGISECVDDILSSLGGDVRLSLPIGAGKPTLLANEFYRRAKENRNIKLKIISGLTLVKPGWTGGLERRFMEPLVQRLFGDYPDPVYIHEAREGRLPENVDLIEFFLLPGAFLGVDSFQQNYISSNYTHVPRDVADLGLNVLATLVGRRDSGGAAEFSLSSNVDASLDMMWKLRDMKKQGRKNFVVGQVNSNLPFMDGAAALAPDSFDCIVDNPAYYHKLYGTPREPVTTADLFIGLYSSALVRDGGTIQIGIGSLGDSIAYALQTRHENNVVYNKVLEDIGAADRFGAEIGSAGGTEPFTQGLYGCTELLTDAFLRLVNCGVIKRKVYDDPHIQRLAAAGRGDKISPDTLDALLAAKAISPRLTEGDFNYLRKFGILRQGLTFESGVISDGNGFSLEADLENPAARAVVEEKFLGAGLESGVLIHSSFFLGPQSFYDELKGMTEEERARIQMREVSFCNQLYGGEELKALQRRESRFFNTSIMVTLLGAAVSDALEDGRVVSGVGGQYNFIAMGHALPDGRSILMVRATKEKNNRLLSDIVWNYGHVTIPRHLRDIFVTEYGIALVRGRTDSDTIEAILNVTDSRFQESLLRKAKEAKKLPADYTIPAKFRSNFPERLEKELEQYRKQGLFPPFPFGTELTREELVLGKALKELKARMSTPRKFRLPSPSELSKTLSVPAAAKPFLERMALDNPRDFKEKALGRLVVYALAAAGAI